MFLKMKKLIKAVFEKAVFENEKADKSFVLFN